MSNLSLSDQILWENFMDASDEINEAKFQMDTIGVIRWAIIADTFGAML